MVMATLLEYVGTDLIDPCALGLIAQRLIGTRIYDRELTRDHLDTLVLPALDCLGALIAQYGDGFFVSGIECRVRFPGVPAAAGTVDAWSCAMTPTYCTSTGNSGPALACERCTRMTSARWSTRSSCSTPRRRRQQPQLVHPPQAGGRHHPAARRRAAEVTPRSPAKRSRRLSRMCMPQWLPPSIRSLAPPGRALPLRAAQSCLPALDRAPARPLGAEAGRQAGRPG